MVYSQFLFYDSLRKNSIAENFIFPENQRKIRRFLRKNISSAGYAKKRGGPARLELDR
jgi:hypothetical protein